MPRPKKPFTVTRRADSKTFQFSLNPACGLPDRVCRNWQRVSFQKFPSALALHRLPKNKAAAEAGVYDLTNSELPKKRSKRNPLTEEDRRRSCGISSGRVANEHAIGFVKRFRIVSEKYRNRRHRFGLRFNSKLSLSTMASCFTAR